MRIATIFAGACLPAATAASLFAASAAVAQLPPQLQIGQMEVKAYQTISKSKVAVQLSQDTALGRQLRGKVMERLAKRGNEVGFSGGNVMRMDVLYFDLLGGGGGGGSSAANIPSSDSPGDNPHPPMLGNISGLRGNDSSAPPPRPPTLRLTFTLYAVDTGKVLWVASASCSTTGGMVAKAGEAMINSIFDNADKSIVGDAGCPL
jgi:hypothetical protein